MRSMPLPSHRWHRVSIYWAGSYESVLLTQVLSSNRFPRLKRLFYWWESLLCWGRLLLSEENAWVNGTECWGSNHCIANANSHRMSLETSLYLLSLGAQHSSYLFPRRFTAWANETEHPVNAVKSLTPALCGGWVSTIIMTFLFPCPQKVTLQISAIKLGTRLRRVGWRNTWVVEVFLPVTVSPTFYQQLVRRIIFCICCPL